VLTAQEQVATRRAALKDRELDTEIRKPADARRYAVEVEAEAERNAAIARAEAEAQQLRLQGEAQRSQREQLAEAVRAEGQATADATRAAGEAEASAMARKAQAYGEYGDAAILDLLATALPGIVGAAAEPMGNIDKLTVISTDGASDVTRSVTSTVAQGMQVAGDLTGFDLPQLMAALVARRAAGADA
jgi:flotillin